MAQKAGKTGKKKRRKERDGNEMVIRAVWILVGVLLVSSMIILMMGFAPKFYRFGYALFSEEAGTGVEVTVEFSVDEGEPARVTADRLRERGLIDSEWIFLLQRAFFDKQIVAGTHTLNSNMTTMEILDALSSTESAP